MKCSSVYYRSLILLPLLALAACKPAPVPPVPVAEAPLASTASEAVQTVKQHPIEDFIDTTGVSGASFSPDESQILFSSNKTGIWNAYTMPASGGEWKPVTHSTTDNTYSEAWFPADDRKLVSRDQGGNELDHLYVIEADGSERDLNIPLGFSRTILLSSHSRGSFEAYAR